MDKIKFSVITLIILSLLIGPLALKEPVYAVTSAEQILRVPGDVGDLQNAIYQISDGGVIELAAGIYIPPHNGWRMNDLHKGFTIRAAEGATVTFDGLGTRDIIRFQNSAVSNGGPVTFERIVFANGYTKTEGTAAGLTLYNAEATFVDCVFRDNNAKVNTTVGGAVYVAENSRVFFFNTTWYNNTTICGGGALGIRSGSSVYIHNSQFTNNRTLAVSANEMELPSGGAINAGNSDLYITNTRFEGNVAGSYGGALYAIGSWQVPWSTPRMNVILANTTFINNKCLRHSANVPRLPTEGGAVNVEDQALLLVYHSRFIKNSAEIGGGVNSYRADVEIYNSVFLGNQAIGELVTASFGGSINMNSGDYSPGTYTNWPNANLTIEDSYIQGAYEDVTTVAHKAGCLNICGDASRIDGDESVPDIGSIEDNRATAIIRRVTFNDCDVHLLDKRNPYGGAIVASIVDMTLTDSLIVNSDAFGDNSTGGGMVVFWNSIVNISNSTFAYNTSGLQGAAIYVNGSQLNMLQNSILHNELSPGFAETKWGSQGAAIYSTPDYEHSVNVDGSVTQNTFSSNAGMTLFELDENNGPINDLKYNGNSLLSTGQMALQQIKH